MSKGERVGGLGRRLGRIESKCEILLREVRLLRRCCGGDIDGAIDGLRAAAARLRRQCEDERDALLGALDGRHGR